MNIAVDTLAMLGRMSKNRGIGNYNISQFKKIFEQDKENNYFLLNLYDDCSLKEQLNYGDNVKEVYFSCGTDNFLSINPAYHNLIGEVIKNFIKENNIDVFHISSPFDGTLIYDLSWFEGVNTVATVYDIIPYIFKDVYLADKNTNKGYMKCIENVKRVDRIAAISQSVKNDLVNYLGIDKDKIDVIYAGVETCYQKIDIDEKEKQELFSKFGIKDKYVMCTGGGDGRKNIKELIIAFSNMPKELINEHQLVIVCKLNKDEVEMYTGIAREHGIKDRVVFTNFVSLEDLILLYNLATLMAFPSKYEGFGLPVVEAMACGTAVLTSNNSSLGEIADGAAVLVDPFSTEDITRGLTTALSKTDLDDLISKGYERVKLFTWENVARDSIQMLSKLKKKQTIKEDMAKKKIAWFSPLPPIQSGISDYSVDMLNALSNYFDIDVFIDDGYTADCSLKSNVKVFNHNEFKYNNYSNVVYQMGNSEYHIYMFKYIRKYKGVVVLHDYNLHGALNAYTTKKKDIKLYEKLLNEDYTEDTVHLYIDKLRNQHTKIKEFEMPTNGFVTNYADKIIVHSDYAKKKLLEKNIARNVKTILHYTNIEPISDNNPIRREMGISEDEIILASFGHIHRTKRIMPILYAFNELVGKYKNIKYIFVGKLDSQIEQEFNNYIADNNLNDKVVVTGYTPIDEFVKYIDAADICLNLRYPYNGETSGSLMRILAKGKCVIVNDIGSFGEIPDECCIKIKSPENIAETEETEAIFNELDKLISDKSKIYEYGKKAREYAENNLDINIIVKQYFEFINSKKTSVLTEKMLKNINETEIKKDEYNEKEVYELAKTLAYSKYVF